MQYCILYTNLHIFPDSCSLRLGSQISRNRQKSMPPVTFFLPRQMVPIVRAPTLASRANPPQVRQAASRAVDTQTV